MTNEKAIEVLAELREYGHTFALIGDDRKEALDMAIKAIAQQGYVWETAYKRGKAEALNMTIMILEEQSEMLSK